jgi:hypothetical protein
LTRPSLQTLQRSPRAAGRVAAAAQPYGCSRSIVGGCAGTRASSRDGFAPTHAAPAPGSRDSRHRSRASPVATVAVVHAGRRQHRNNVAVELANAAGMLGRRPHIAGSPLMHLRAHDLHEEAFGTAGRRPQPQRLSMDPDDGTPLASPRRRSRDRPTIDHRKAVGQFLKHTLGQFR